MARSKKYKVLPCPFCGNQYKGNVFVWKGEDASLDCPHCGATGPYPARDKFIPYSENLTDKQAKMRDAAAIAAWNRRPNPKKEDQHR